jgi:hypothetical protein
MRDINSQTLMVYEKTTGPENPVVPLFSGGHSWVRTNDLLNVSQAISR